MARRSAPRPRLLDVVLTALLSLFLAAVIATASGTVGVGADGRVPVGPFGEWLGQFTRGAVGPVLAWTLPILAWAWIPLRRAKSKLVLIRRVGWTVGLFVAMAALLAHDHLARLGVPEAAGGRLGEFAESAVAGVIGPLGSFLLLASAGSWLLLKPLPPLHLDLPALDGLTERASDAMSAIAGAILSVLRWVGRLGSSLSARLSAAAQAWAEERRRRREGDYAEEEGVEAAAGDSAADGERGPLARRRRGEVGAPAEPDLETGWDEALETEVSGDEEYDEVDSDEEEEDEYEYEYEDDDEEAEDEEEEQVAARVVEAAPPPSWAGNGGVAHDEFRLSRDPQELTAEDEAVVGSKRKKRRGDLPLPSLDLLDETKKEQRGFSSDDLQMNARLLLETLGNFGIEGQINEIRPGPVVTTFEFEPAPGVKVSQIVSRADDLALAMRATRIRIEAPIPGKAAVGIEIPNPYPQMVGLRQVIGAMQSDPAEAPLEIAFGKDTEGEPFSSDLAEMPHLLVAGATGSGKSVCINAIICNLLLRNGPDRVRLLMIDPKMLELSVYNGIPHLMHPVITQAADALKAVKYMVAEMETRYARLARHGVRNIKDFNTKVKAGKAVDAKTGEKIKEPLAYCVFVIDELADLMMQLGSDLEIPIARLAQMARAVGIHLVLATQRPSVNVITGVIKANFPSRIGFRVISKIDSRTILDGSGAEQLLGKGDMLLLLAGRAQPVRVHGAYISMEECERVVAHWLPYADQGPEQITLDSGSSIVGGIDLGEDELFDHARAMVIATQMGSTTMLQRRLRVGYTRAARLMDMLEAAMVVGPFEGSKARKVLVGKEELEGES